MDSWQEKGSSKQRVFTKAQFCFRNIILSIMTITKIVIAIHDLCPLEVTMFVFYKSCIAITIAVIVIIGPCGAIW